MQYDTRHKRTNQDFLVVGGLVIFLMCVLTIGLAKAACSNAPKMRLNTDTLTVVDTVYVYPEPENPAFLPQPAEDARVSSHFSASRYHPVLKRRRPHRGVDFAAPRGTPVESTGSGVVTHLGRLGGLGNAVVIRHPKGFTTRYGHLQSFAPGLKEGDRVCQGDLIGLVGSTGLATGPHVHYEIIHQGAHLDPLQVFLTMDD